MLIRCSALAEAARIIRVNDTLFDTQDAHIRECLRCLSKEVVGFEAVISYRDLKHDFLPEEEVLIGRKQAWVVVLGEFYELGSKE